MTTQFAASGGAQLFQPGAPVPAGCIDLGLGYPDPSTLPPEATDLAALPADRRAAALGYGPARGNDALIEGLRGTVMRDLTYTESFLVTNGALEAVQLALRALAVPGGVLLAEEYTFPGLITAARDLAIELVPVRTGAEGIDVADLEAQLAWLGRLGRPVIGVYVMPTASNPTGTCLNFVHREALAEVVRRYSVILFEDDAYRDVYLDGAAPPPVANLAPDQVLHVRSLSKVLCPGVRLAGVVGPADLIEAMSALRPVGGTSPLASEMLGWFLRTTDYDRYLTALRQTYRRRRDHALAAFAPSSSIEVAAPAAGFFLWLEVPGSGEEIYAAALNRGVRVLPGSAFALDGRDDSRIRIAYSYATLDQVAAGIDLLKQVIDKKSI